MLKQKDGKLIKPIVYPRYFIYDKSDGDERIIYGGTKNLIKYDINIQNLKAISKDMLYDGKYIINHGKSGIEVIPIHKLGFDIKILTNNQ